MHAPFVSGSLLLFGSRWKAGAAAGLILLALNGCAIQSGQQREADATARDGNARPASNNPFAELNALAREAAALNHPVAQYEFYRQHYESSSGIVHGFIGQVLASSAAELGAYDKAIALFPQPAPKTRRPPAELPDPARFHPVAAADGIVELARDRRIVMINEAHHDAHTRVLTLALLPRLRELGFTHFAAESLNEDDAGLAARGYPVRASGPYVREPLYAEIIRTALRLGFKVIAYEGSTSDVEAREEDQARHLADRVFRAQPDARLFVHAGYAHVHKLADYLGPDTMAMRLKRKTGFDPLVVDQTVLRPAAPGHEYADYRKLLESFAVESATIFVSGDGKSAWSLEPRFYDVSVLLPPTHLVDGRPDWLALGGEREPIAVDPQLRPDALPCAVEARYAGEGDDAVPADRVLVETGGGPLFLYLRPGDYRVATTCVEGSVPGTRQLHVDPRAGATRIPSPAPSR